MKKNTLLAGLLGLMAVALVGTFFTISNSGSGTLKGSFTPSNQLFRNPGLVLSTNNITFETTAQGARSVIPVTITNPTNSAVNVSWQQNPMDPAFTMEGTPAMLAANASQVVNFVFSPVDAGGRVHRSQIVFWVRGTPSAITMSGTGLAPYRILEAVPTPVNFGEVYAGRMTHRVFTIQNQTNSPIHFTWEGFQLYRAQNGQLRHESIRSGFYVYNYDPNIPFDVSGFDVPARGTHAVAIAFAPRNNPHYALNISLVGAGLTTNFNLVGTACSPFMVSPTVLNFPPTAVGNTSHRSFTVRNISERAIELNMQSVSLPVRRGGGSFGFRLENERQFVIQPSGQHEVNISFSPNMANESIDAQASSLVYFNDASTGVNITLRATSIPR